MDRATITRRLPAGVKRRLRPLVIPAAYRVEQRRLRRLYESFVDAGDLVFDVGAAEGYHAAVLRSLGARVVCIEPQPRFIAELESRFANDPDTIIEACGLGADAGRLELAVSVGDPELSTFAIEKWSAGPYAGRQWEQRVLVEVTTVDELVTRHGSPAFIKIDVEGYEAQVLRGMSHPPPALSFEFNAELFDDVEICARRLVEIGADRFNYSWGRRHELAAPEWLPMQRLIDQMRSSSGRHPISGDVFARG